MTDMIACATVPGSSARIEGMIEEIVATVLVLILTPGWAIALLVASA